MYVAPTPFGLVSGVAHTQTLILPEDFPVTGDFQDVGTLTRKEAGSLIIGYTFNLRDNTLTPEIIPNPSAGREHVFHAWRLVGSSNEPAFRLHIWRQNWPRLTVQDSQDSGF